MDATSGPVRRPGRGGRRGRSPALTALLLVVVALGILSAGHEGVSALQLQADGPPVGVVSNVITGPVRAVTNVRAAMSTASAQVLAAQVLLAVILVAAALAAVLPVRRRRASSITARQLAAHAVPAAWRGPPARAR